MANGTIRMVNSMAGGNNFGKLASGLKNATKTATTGLKNPSKLVKRTSYKGKKK